MFATALDLPRVDVAIDTPTDLSDKPGVWRLVSGHIEVFAIVEQGGRPVGNRRFIGSVVRGDALMSVGRLPGRPTCRLVATALHRATLERIGPDEEPVSALAIERWIVAVAVAAARGCGPRQGGNLLLPGETVSFAAGTEIRAGGGVVWAEIVAGSALLLGATERLLPPGAVVPLTACGWIAAGPGGVELRGFTTRQAQADARWLGRLGAWQAQLQAILAARTQAAENAEADRLRLVATFSRQALRVTTAGLAATLVGKRPTRPASAEEPLIAACRAVAQAMGFDIPIPPPRALNRQCGIVERIARISGAPAREVALQGRWWRDEMGPLIAFHRLSRTPIALLPVTRGRYVASDPVTGEVQPLTEAFANRLDARAYVVYPPLPDRPLRVRDLVRLGFSQSRRDLGRMVAAGAIGSLLGLAVPVATGVLVDDFIPGHLTSQLHALGGMLLLIVMVMVTLRITQDLAQLRIIGRSASRLQPAVIDRTMRLGLGFLTRFTSADLARRVMVIDTVRHGLGVLVMDGILSGVFSLTSILLLCALSPPLAAVATLLAIPFLAAASWAGRAQLPALAIAEARAAEAAQLAFLLIDNISQLRTAGAEERAFALWGTLHRALHASLLQASRIQNRLAGFANGYGIIGLAVFYAALVRLRPADLTLGQAVMMVSVYGNFIATSTGFSLGLQKVFLLGPKLARAGALLAAQPEVEAFQTDPGDLAGRIEVSHVSFGYAERGPPILDDISLSIEAGEFVAWVGPSGAGKSTLMKLLLGFEPVHSGGIFFDGQELKRLDIRAVRRQIGTVLQTDRLLPGTLFDNILGVTGGTNEAAWEAARLAGLAEDIQAMPMGMHTMLTDGANVLSGGQVQRLLIARALAGRPRLIFLDEATSALDNASQAIVMQSLERLAVTRIVIAHRLSTVRHARRIFVFKDGRIEQAGTYDQLAGSRGLFAELIRRQEA